MNGKSIEQIIKENEDKIKKKKEKIKDIIVQEKYYNFETKDYMTSKKTEKVEQENQQKNESKETKQESKIINFSNDSSNSQKQKLNDVTKKEILIQEEKEEPDKFFEEEIKKENLNLKLLEKTKNKIESQKNSVNASKIENRKKVILSNIDNYNNKIPIQNKSRISHSSRPYEQNLKNGCTNSANTYTNTNGVTNTKNDYKNKIHKDSTKIKASYACSNVNTLPNSRDVKSDSLYNTNSHLVSNKKSDTYRFQGNQTYYKDKFFKEETKKENINLKLLEQTKNKIESQKSSDNTSKIENRKKVILSNIDNYSNTIPIQNKSRISHSARPYGQNLKNGCINSAYAYTNTNGITNTKNEYNNKLLKDSTKLKTSYACSNVNTLPNSRAVKSDSLYNTNPHLLTNKKSDIYRFQGNQAYYKPLTYFKRRLMPQKYKGKTDPVLIFHLLNKEWQTYSILTRIKK